MRVINRDDQNLQNNKNKTYINEQVIKQSDVKMKDVLINGMKLRNMKPYCVKVNNLIKRQKLKELLSLNLDHQDFEDVEGQEKCIFKNLAIKNRLKSLDLQDNKESKINQISIESDDKRKNTFQQDLHKMDQTSVSFRIKNYSNQKCPSPSPIEHKRNSSQRYENFIQKQITAMTTKNTVNNSIYTSEAQPIRYKKFKSVKYEKPKSLSIQVESNLFDKQIIEDKNQKRYYSTIRQSNKIGTDISKNFRKCVLDISKINHLKKNEDSNKLKLLFAHKFSNYKTQKSEDFAQIKVAMQIKNLSAKIFHYQ